MLQGVAPEESVAVGDAATLFGQLEVGYGVAVSVQLKVVGGNPDPVERVAAHVQVFVDGDALFEVVAIISCRIIPVVEHPCQLCGCIHLIRFAVGRGGGLGQGAAVPGLIIVVTVLTSPESILPTMLVR